MVYPVQKKNAHQKVKHKTCTGCTHGLPQKKKDPSPHHPGRWAPDRDWGSSHGPSVGNRWTPLSGRSAETDHPKY